MKHLNQPPEPPHVLDSGLPLPISEAILKALAPREGDRFQSAGDLVILFTPALQNAA